MAKSFKVKSLYFPYKNNVYNSGDILTDEIIENAEDLIKKGFIEPVNEPVETTEEDEEFKNPLKKKKWFKV